MALKTIDDLDLTPPDDSADLATWLARNFGILLDVHFTSSVFTRNAFLQGRATTTPDTVGDSAGITLNYMNGGASPAPPGNDHSLITMSYSAGWQTQIAADWRNKGRLYIRSQENGVWSSWYQVWAENDFIVAVANNINTVVKRDGSGDINARLFRSEYDTTNPTINFIMTQIDTANNNYIRPSTPAQFRAAVTDAAYLGISAKATDSELLDGVDGAGYLLVNAKAADSELLDGIEGAVLRDGSTSQAYACSNLAFPAVQVPSADPNTQDDYEEGDWDPELWDSSNSNNEGQTYGPVNAQYTKNGNVVHFKFDLAMTSLGSLTTSSMVRIGNFPFVCAAASSGSGGVVLYASGLNLPAAAAMAGIIDGSAAYMNMRKFSSLVGTSNMTLAELSSNGRLILNGWYETE